ncbi:hypothetical protein I316_02297 [Kwoniella heveanensis BCC8398]|uniref:Uncharacterized protein n=1 Tax=Kwoniella heveanensis BCC8398 TaxID=1296120 RepID=A0A1B9GXN1_9TREE|nr:hypothetical protein I316_02297 [Kwoniella heveanensis BCC8398]
MTYSMKTFLLESIWPQGRAAPRDVQLFTQKPEQSRYGDDDNQGSFTKDGGIGGDACQVFVTPSTVAALAAKPRLDIYIVHPSFEGIDDATLQSLLQAYPPKGIVLLEDIVKVKVKVNVEFNN